jgi:hypothetical protein
MLSMVLAGSAVLAASQSQVYRNFPNVHTNAGTFKGTPEVQGSLIYDVTGQPVIGKLGPEGNNVYLKVGAGHPIWYKEEQTIIPGGTVEINDTGRIRNTWIERTSTGVTLHWGFDYQGPTNAKIYIAKTDQYPTTAGDYTLYNNVSSAITQQPIPNVDLGEITYFRVVPELLVNGNMLDDANNSVTASKFSWWLPKGLSLVNAPIYPTAATGDPANLHIDRNLNNIIGNQLVAVGCAVYSWDMSDPNFTQWTLVPANYDGTSFGSPPPFSIELAKGLWIYRNLADNVDVRSVTVVGVVRNVDFSQNIERSLNLIGSPFPLRTYSISTFGLAGSGAGDSLYYWDGTALAPVNYLQTGWEQASFPINPWMGYWYYRNVQNNNPLVWSLTKP